jgi:hypothetical protein
MLKDSSFFVEHLFSSKMSDSSNNFETLFLGDTNDSSLISSSLFSSKTSVSSSHIVYLCTWFLDWNGRPRSYHVSFSFWKLQVPTTTTLQALMFNFWISSEATGSSWVTLLFQNIRFFQQSYLPRYFISGLNSKDKRLTAIHFLLQNVRFFQYTC